MGMIKNEAIKQKNKEDIFRDCASCRKQIEEEAYKRGKAMKPDPDGVYENGYRDGKRNATQEIFETLEKRYKSKIGAVCILSYEWQAFWKEYGL